MNVKIIDRPHCPITTIFKAFRTCYSADVPTEIKIPMRETSIGDIPDKSKMIEFIKDKMDLGHESPLEHCSFTFAIEGVSRALLAQITRHRTFKFSVQSQRYVDAENFDFVIPEIIENNPDMIEEFIAHFGDVKLRYKKLIESGVPKEDARAILPNATTTNLIVTADLRNFRHFFKERRCKHAQKEIRELAEEMMYQVREYVPFADYKAIKCGLTCFQCYKIEQGE